MSCCQSITVGSLSGPNIVNIRSQVTIVKIFRPPYSSHKRVYKKIVNFSCSMLTMWIWVQQPVHDLQHLCNIHICSYHIHVFIQLKTIKILQCYHNVFIFQFSNVLNILVVHILNTIAEIEIISVKLRSSSYCD